jgi:hypothetical protein
MKPITITVFADPDGWLRKNLWDFTWDGVAPVVPYGPWLAGQTMQYRDTEEGSTKDCTWADHLTALRLLCEQIGQTLHVGGLKSAIQLTDPGNWDAEVVDAFFQLVYRGEVIYG